MARRKTLSWAAIVVAAVLTVSTIMYPTWLTDYTFRSPWGDSMTWLRLCPLVCMAVVLVLVFIAAVCHMEPKPSEAKTKVLKRTPAPN